MCCRGQYLVKTEGLMELVALQQSGTLGALSSLAQRGLMQVNLTLITTSVY